MCGRVPGVDGPVEEHADCIALYQSCRSAPEPAPPPAAIDLFAESPESVEPASARPDRAPARPPAREISASPPFKVPVASAHAF